MNQEAVFSLLSANAYFDVRPQLRNQAPLPDGWTVLPEFDISASGPNASLLGSGFTARVYRGPSGQIVIAYAGTEFGNTALGLITDFAQGNLPLGVGLAGLQAFEAALLYEKVQARFGTSADISFTGHSLGGGLASLMAVWFDRPATVFAPAPFELSALSGPGTVLMLAVRSYLAAAGYSDPRFNDYVALQDFANRESRVTSYGVTGEVVGLIPLVDRIEGVRNPLFGGTQWGANDLASLLASFSAENLGIAVSKHSIDLHAAALLVPALESAAAQLPEALPLLFDASLYNHPLGGTQQNGLLKLIRGEVGVRDELTGAQIAAPNGDLSRFTDELGGFVGDTGLVQTQVQLRAALVAAALEYYYFKDVARTARLFTVANGGLHFDLADAGITAQQSKALPRLTAGLDFYLAPDEKDYAVYLRAKTSWHIQQGADPLVWTDTAGKRDVVIGGASVDVINAGAGEDVVLGGADTDVLNGEGGRDILIGGIGDDILTGGEGNDELVGGYGNDTYHVAPGSGSDTIIDSDGEGAVVFNGSERITGGKTFQKYGMLEGKVVQISADALEPEQAARAAGQNTAPLTYRAVIDLEAQQLPLPNGKQLDLARGKAATMQIHQRRRTVMEYLLSPVQHVGQEAGMER